MVTTLEHTATSAQPKGGGLARRQNFATAIIAGGVLAWVFWLVAHKLFFINSDNYSDEVAVMTATGWMIGFWIGIGAFNGPFRWLLGRDHTRDDDLYYAGHNMGRSRYWKFTTDHKVVGVQYIITTMGLLAVGGILAMAIRTELIVPGSHFVNQQVYNGFVAIHGMVMILALIVAVAGPWGNFVMPIMIGARDMAFPRLNALSLWTLVSAAVLLVTVLAVGGLPVGWVVMGTIADQAGVGMDFFAMAIVVFTVSTTVASINLITTVITMRTKGMTLDRLPIFVWGTIITAVLALYAFPFFFVAELNQILDRTVSTSFYRRSGWRDELAAGESVLADGSPRGIRDLDTCGCRPLRDLRRSWRANRCSAIEPRLGRWWRLAGCPRWSGRTTCSPPAGLRRSAVRSW